MSFSMFAVIGHLYLSCLIISLLTGFIGPLTMDYFIHLMVPEIFVNF